MKKSVIALSIAVLVSGCKPNLLVDPVNKSRLSQEIVLVPPKNDAASASMIMKSTVYLNLSSCTAGIGDEFQYQDKGHPGNDTYYYTTTDCKGNTLTAKKYSRSYDDDPEKVITRNGNRYNKDAYQTEVFTYSEGKIKITTLEKDTKDGFKIVYPSDFQLNVYQWFVDYMVGIN